MLGSIIILAFWGLVFAFGIRSGLFSFFARMLSRVFVSGQRRPAPPVVRGGGLADLPEGLAALIRGQRVVEAAIADLRELSPAYHRSFESEQTGILDDRRRQALRRDFEDATVHVTRSLDAWCRSFDALDERERARLAALGPIPDVHGLLRRFRWLPRQVYQTGRMHFRNDEQAFEQRLFELGEQMSELEDRLTHERAQAYR